MNPDDQYKLLDRLDKRDQALVAIYRSTKEQRKAKKTKRINKRRAHR